MHLAAALTLSLLSAAPEGHVRLKDLADVEGMRGNDLFGYGLVVGLSGTGDTEQVLFTSQSMSGMLGRLGVRVDPRAVRSRNVAAVMVTARLPTYARPGSRLDVTVSSIGNARSLAGGVLLVTSLGGADGEIYALAQGPVQVGGFEARGVGGQVRKNHPTTGAVPQGGTVERAVAPEVVPLEGPLRLALRTPDFTHAHRAAQAIDAALGAGSARAVDAAVVEVTPPAGLRADPVALFAQLEAVEVPVQSRAKVVVSERTGTVVIGAGVRLRPAAVAHGGLRVTIRQGVAISQPGPLSGGSTVVAPVGEVDAEEEPDALRALPEATTVEALVAALNGLGATPRELVAILQALRAAGALDAELEVQ